MTILGTVESRLLRIHQTIYEATRGTVGHRLIGVPTLLLTSTGRRTGRRRTAALVYANDDDGSLIVTASNGGAYRPPGWLHNVKADGSVEVQIGRGRFDIERRVKGSGNRPIIASGKRRYPPSPHPDRSVPEVTGSAAATIHSFVGDRPCRVLNRRLGDDQAPTDSSSGVVG